MKKTEARTYYLAKTLRRKATAKRTLSAERAKVKLPYKSEHLSEDELKQGLARLAT
jgi:hypothetical protein